MHRMFTAFITSALIITLIIALNISYIFFFIFCLILKIGIESGFYTVKTAFATASSVQEGLEIVRRTGAKVST